MHKTGARGLPPDSAFNEAMGGTMSVTPGLIDGARSDQVSLNYCHSEMFLSKRLSTCAMKIGFESYFSFSILCDVCVFCFETRFIWGRLNLPVFQD